MRDTLIIIFVLILLFISVLFTTSLFTGELFANNNLKYSFYAFSVIAGIGCIDALIRHSENKNKGNKELPNQSLESDD